LAIYSIILIFTARRYTERGIATASRLSVTLKYHDHIGWNSSEIESAGVFLATSRLLYRFVAQDIHLFCSMRNPIAKPLFTSFVASRSHTGQTQRS